MRPLFTLAPPLESCWVPTSLTPAILQHHEKQKCLFGKWQNNLLWVGYTVLCCFNFWVRRITGYQAETSLLLLEFCNLLLGNVAIAEGTSPNDRMWSGVWFWYSMSYTGPDRIWTWHLFFFLCQKQRPFVPQTLVRIIYFLIYVSWPDSLHLSQETAVSSNSFTKGSKVSSGIHVMPVSLMITTSKKPLQASPFPEASV